MGQISRFMLTADFDYHLPPELIASEPLTERSASRMMVVHRASGHVEHRQFREFPSFLAPGDLLVLNDTRVVPVRFFTDQGHEILRLKALSPTRWQCMVRPGKKFRIGHEHRIGAATGRVVEILPENGDRIIEWDQIVDIQSSKGAAARCIFAGEVTGVINIPGSYAAVIVRHGEFLTVYSNLEGVLVRKGDKLTTKQKIGTIHCDTETNVAELNFQIWKGFTKLDPQAWLKR